MFSNTLILMLGLLLALAGLFSLMFTVHIMKWASDFHGVSIVLLSAAISMACFCGCYLCILFVLG